MLRLIYNNHIKNVKTSKKINNLSTKIELFSEEPNNISSVYTEINNKITENLKKTVNMKEPNNFTELSQKPTDSIRKEIINRFIEEINNKTGYNFKLATISEFQAFSQNQQEFLFKYRVFIHDQINIFGIEIFANILVEYINNNSVKIKGITKAEPITHIETKQYENSIPNTNEYLVNDYSENEYFKYTSIYDLAKAKKYYFSSEDEIMSQGLVNKFLTKVKNIITGKEDEGICFGTTGIWKTKELCEKNAGIWDTPVKNSNECPYYLSNKNYPNSYGGVNFGGYCQLPQGMQLIGFRHINPDPKYNPICNNCKITNKDGNIVVQKGKCCQEQQNNPVMYPELLSPDYIF